MSGVLLDMIDDYRLRLDGEEIELQGIRFLPEGIEVKIDKRQNWTRDKFDDINKMHVYLQNKETGKIEIDETMFLECVELTSDSSGFLIFILGLLYDRSNN